MMSLVREKMTFIVLKTSWFFLNEFFLQKDQMRYKKLFACKIVRKRIQKILVTI